MFSRFFGVTSLLAVVAVGAPPLNGVSGRRLEVDDVLCFDDTTGVLIIAQFSSDASEELIFQINGRFFARTPTQMNECAFYVDFFRIRN